jgi:hypothetical protein
MRFLFGLFLTFLSFSVSYSQTCEGMFNVYDSCFDINNCDDGYNSTLSLALSTGLSKPVAEKFASICKSACLNKKANVRKLNKDEFSETFCMKTISKEVKKIENPAGNNK